MLDMDANRNGERERERVSEPSCKARKKIVVACV